MNSIRILTKLSVVFALAFSDLAQGAKFEKVVVSDLFSIEDVKGEKTLEDVLNLSPESFSKSQGLEFNYGIGEGVYWVKFNIKNISTKRISTSRILKS